MEPLDDQAAIGRLRRLNTLLDEVLALDGPERRHWLDTLPEQDGELVATLRRMLEQQQVETKDFLAYPQAVQQIAREAFSDEDETGTRVGPYRLIAELGRGGMAAVWLAERDDDTIKRQVAVKLPLSNRVPGLARRMRRESEILAALEHPHIARLYDAGVTEMGRPYLALEYVEGKAIDVYCKERNLGLPERLRLILQVAQAVSHAHARLIVHRDLKPNNILVTPSGQVRLLDFGVAKLLSGEDDPSSGKATQLTQITGRALTLEYASPEQIRSERVTVASDVYSLGVVLYELLTGQLPHRPKRRTALAVEEAITGKDAPLASSMAEKQFARGLRGDLDVILGKALKKRIAERYSSVEAFAADIQRFLKGEPVLAQKDSTWYRTHKFVRRHVGGVAAGLAIMLAIGVGSGLAVWQTHVANESRRKAIEAKDVAEQANEVLEAVEALQRYLLTSSSGSSLSNDLLKRAERVIAVQFAKQPALRAHLQIELANMLQPRSESSRAIDLLKAAVAASTEAGDAPLAAKANCELASYQGREGRTSEALIVLDKNIADLARNEVVNNEALASCLIDRAILRQALGASAADVAADARRVLSLIRIRPSNLTTRSYLQTLVSEAEFGLGSYKTAADIDRGALREMQESGQGDAQVARTIRNHLARILSEAGQMIEAATLQREVFDDASREGLSFSDPIFANYARYVSELGRSTEASMVIEKSLQKARSDGGARSIAFITAFAAQIECGAARALECEKLVDDALPRLEPLVGKAHPMYAGALNTLGVKRRLRGDLDGAVTALELSSQRFGETDRSRIRRVDPLVNLVDCYLAQGRLVDAEASANLAVDLARQYLSGYSHSSWYGKAALAAGKLAYAKNDTPNAKKWTALAEENALKSVGPESPLVRDVKVLAAKLAQQMN